MGITGVELAKFANCDRSLISRIKSGGRILEPSSKSIEKLVNGIFLFADDKNEMEKLISAVSCPSENPKPDEIKNYILLYLYEGNRDKESKAQKRRKKAKTASRSDESKAAYGTKLNAVINIADISNIRLSKMLHIDPSSISRFKKGLRIPKANKKLTDDICNVLFNRVWELGRISELLKLAGIPAQLSADKEECYERFCGWLCDFEAEDTSSFVENLLDNISSFSADVKTPLPAFDEAAPDKIIRDKKSVYFGTDGLRCAVIRFLGNAICAGAKELFLYSDQNIDWMTHDIAFRLKWMALMRECVGRGIKIHIIHNINRSLDEMSAAINSWLPLYMSGMIEPYYCNMQGESRFSTTVFLCPSVACISSVHVCGCEDKGIYRYDTDGETLKVYGMYYKKLFGMSKPLVRIYREYERGKTVQSDGRGVTAIHCTLSLATMPETLIKSMIKRTGLDDAAGRRVISEWSAKSRAFAGELKGGYVHECICPAEDELLFDGDVPVDLQSASITYTPQEYREHIKNIIALSESNPNYRFYALPDTPFTNISVVISEKSVAVTRLLPPQITFAFSHHAMRDAFSGYADYLKGQYKQDKITTKRRLERYV